VEITAEILKYPTETLRKRVVTTGCGKGTTFGYGIDEESLPPLLSTLTVSVRQIFSLMKQLLDRSSLYKETRGVHNSAIASVNAIEVFHSDVGRHNAVDKIYGQCILENRSTENKLLVTTGRLTSEIILKCARMGIPALISRHAATTLAVDLAKQLNMTLIGYVRGSSLTVYTLTPNWQKSLKTGLKMRASPAL
jgi:FdhD protein